MQLIKCLLLKIKLISPADQCQESLQTKNHTEFFCTIAHIQISEKIKYFKLLNGEHRGGGGSFNVILTIIVVQ